MEHVERLGQLVRDKITGVTGTCDATAVTLHGNVRLAITPAVETGKVESLTYWVDSVAVEVVDPVWLTGVVVPASSPGVDVIGTRVRDSASGFEGVAVDAIFSMNGCVQHGVQGPYDKPGSEPVLYYVNATRLRPVAGAPESKVEQTRTGASRTRGRP